MRMDVYCKYRLFFEKTLDFETNFTKDFYLKHIEKRTNFIEPIDNYGSDKKRKIGSEQHLKAADALFRSMKKSGFDPKFAIPYNKGILNGAHRLACSLAIGIDPVYKKADGMAKDWCFRWFKDFNKRSKMNLLYDYSKFNRVSVFCLWGNYEDKWPDMQRIIYENMIVVGCFVLNPENMPELVKDIYKSDSKKICSKAKNLLPRVKVFVCDQNHKKALETKKKIRKLCGDINSCHASDTNDESEHMAKTLCSWNNIRVLKYRQNLKPEFTNLIKGCRGVVVGGAAMRVVCDYQNSDIDIIGDDDGFDHVRAGYSDKYTDDQIVNHPDLHYLVRGIKFCNPEIVIKRKLQQGRDKDLKAVKMFKELHENN